MNEILQQRIESVQAGRNITHAQSVAKRNLREQLDSDLEAFLRKGGKVENLPCGYSGEFSQFNGRSVAPAQKTVRAVMASAVSEAHKKRAQHKEEQATFAEIKALDQWCKERKGRGGDLCRELKVAHSFISQITQQTRPCSKGRYQQIKLAMEVIEQRERVA